MAFMKLKINGLCNNLKPIKPTYELVRKELKDNDYLKLYGALAILWDNNKEIFESYYGIENHNPIECANICSDELYLWDFEGYKLSKRYIIKSLYLNQYDSIVISVCDNKKDRYIDFLA